MDQYTFKLSMVNSDISKVEKLEQKDAWEPTISWTQQICSALHTKSQQLRAESKKIAERSEAIRAEARLLRARMKQRQRSKLPTL
jgi:hypothetical protein